MKEVVFRRGGVLELERAVSCRRADPCWRTKLDFGSGEPFDDLHWSSTRMRGQRWKPTRSSGEPFRTIAPTRNWAGAAGGVYRMRGVSSGGRHGRQAARGDRTESIGAVHVRVWAKDEDCDEKRSAPRSCNGSAFSIYSWPQSPRREGSKQIQTS
jgi:hypothetical protein